MVAHYIATRQIMELYERSVWKPGAWVYLLWCEKEGIYLEGVRERAAAASDGEEEKCGHGAA